MPWKGLGKEQTIMIREKAQNSLRKALARATIACLLFVSSAWFAHGERGLGNSSQDTETMVLAQFLQRISTEERRPARQESQAFRQTTRAHDAAFRQAARTDDQRSRRIVWDYETRFRNERRDTVREKINQTRAQEQVIRNDRASFNLTQTRQRQSLRGATARQRREQTLRISSEVRRTNIERQKANRQRVEEVRDTVRAELQEIRDRTYATGR